MAAVPTQQIDLEEMQTEEPDVREKKRTAKFVCVVASQKTSQLQ